jgi:hypothetical protein
MYKFWGSFEMEKKKGNLRQVLSFMEEEKGLRNPRNPSLCFKWNILIMLWPRCQLLMCGVRKTVGSYQVKIWKKVCDIKRRANVDFFF